MYCRLIYRKLLCLSVRVRMCAGAVGTRPRVDSGELDPGITGPVDKPVREILTARLRTGPGNGRFG